MQAPKVFDDNTLEYVAKSLGEAWPTVSTYLGFNDRECETIIASHPGHMDQQARKMLTTWRARYPGTDMLGDLRGAVRAVGLFLLLHDLGGEVLDDATLQTIAKSVGKSWPKLALYLLFNLEECQAIKTAFSTPKEQAGQMLANWRRNFTGDNPVEYLSRALMTMDQNNLARGLAPQKTLPECTCGNDKALKYRSYFSKGDDGNPRLLGICCTNCSQEWLDERFLFHPDTDESRPSVKVFGVLLKKQLEVPTEQNPAFMVKGSRTKIENFRFVADYLKVGDHITWHRWLGHWHHAIVSNIDPNTARVQVIHWSKSRCGGIRIIESWLDLIEEDGELFCIDYPVDITKVNTPELVIARARSRLDDTGYGFFSDNCEAFASYCKIGLAESCQVVWLYEKTKSVMREVLTNVVQGFTKAGFIVAKEYFKEGAKVFLEKGGAAAARVGAAETFERLANGTNAVGAGFIVFFEGCACVFDLSKIWEAREEGDVSRKDFIASTFQRVTEAVLGAGLAVGGGIAGEMAGASAGAGAGTLIFPGLGTVVGAFIGSIVGGVVGSTFGRYLGTYLGSPISRALATTIGTDDRAVKSIEDLNPGDQVVFYGNLLHPRHHAIVVECDKGKGMVRVVHNTYQNGVVEESVEFRPPVYRLVYDKKDCYPPDEVIKRARSKIGDETYKYSLAFNNCKSFGRWCKVK
ncbi:uncharacterized protein LOC110980814 [Acanthaster planci]|uniref:Uncharacterized protein LOC110980814 n=1 Tax=Acanthaster planci TaxID=133434 RepID=A0A8B7YLJ5_ACAPL|nr:uncharacterized protein LOC110980814 [Acanthaster planci]